MTQVIALLLLANLTMVSLLYFRPRPPRQTEGEGPVARQSNAGMVRRFGRDPVVERAHTASPWSDGDRPATGRMSRVRMGDSYGYANDDQLRPH